MNRLCLFLQVSLAFIVQYLKKEKSTSVHILPDISAFDPEPQNLILF